LRYRYVANGFKDPPRGASLSSWLWKFREQTSFGVSTKRTETVAFTSDTPVCNRVEGSKIKDREAYDLRHKARKG
jgi:hypothetical protein